MAKNDGWETISSGGDPEVEDDGWEDFSVGGALEAVGTFIPKMLAGGLSGVASTLGAGAGGARGEDLSNAFMEGFEGPQDTNFFSPKASKYQQKVMEKIGHGIEAVGHGAELALHYKAGDLYNKEARPAIEAGSFPLATGATEVGLNFLPVGGIIKGTKGLLKGKPKELVPEVKEAPKPGAWEDMPADIFGQDQPSPIPPEVTRSPYNLTEEQRRAGSQDMLQEAEQAGRYGQKQQDLFQTPEEAQGNRFTTTPDIDIRNQPKEGEVNVDTLAADRPKSPGINPWLSTEPEVLEGTRGSVIEPPESLRPGFPLGRKGLGEGKEPPKAGLYNEGSEGLPTSRETLMEIRKWAYEAFDKHELTQEELHKILKNPEHYAESWSPEVAKRLGVDPQHVEVGHEGLGNSGTLRFKWNSETTGPFLDSKNIHDLDKISTTQTRGEDLSNPYSNKNKIPLMAEKGSRATYVPARAFMNFLLTRGRNLDAANPSPLEKSLLRMLEKTDAFKSLTFILEHGHKDTYSGRVGASGVYHIFDHTIELPSNSWMRYKTIIHEGWHAVLYDFLEHRPAHPISMAAKALQMWAMKSLSSDLKAQFPELAGKEVDSMTNAGRSSGDVIYGLSDLHEFMSEGGSNTDFQRVLSTIRTTPEQRQYIRQTLRKAQSEPTSALRNLWDGFKDISRALWEKATGSKVQGTLMDEMFNVLSAGAEGKGSKFDWGTYGTPMEPKRDIALMSKEVDRKGVVESMQEAGRAFKLDNRPIEALIESDLKGKQLEDFTGKDAGLLARAMDRLGSLVKENLLQDTTLKILSEGKAGTGPLIKWTVDQVSRIERDALLRVKEAMDHALTPFRKSVRSPHGKLEMIEAWKTWRDSIGERDLSRGDFKTDKQFQMYSKFQDVFADILSRVNEKRLDAGFKPIERIPSYFHALWEGDYAVTVLDGAGEKKAVHRFGTEFQAERMAKAYRKNHPDMEVEVGHVETSKYGLRDLSAFEDAIRVMSKDDPVTQALLKTYKEVLGHRGFGRTGIHRKGILGFLGSEEGFLGLKDMERSFEQYVAQSNRYISNLEKQKVLQDLAKVPLEQRKSIPETYDFLYSYIKKSQGAKLGEVGLDKLVSQVTRAVGLGESAPARGVRQLASIASLYWLVTPRFLISQMSQSLNSLPKLIQERGTFDGTKMFFEGWANTVKPDAIAKEASEWASQRGYLDATLKNLLGKDLHDVPIGSRYEAFKELATWPAAKIEHDMVRLPVFMMFEKALRETVKNKDERFSEAAEKMDHYMVNYGRTHSPMIFDKAGLIGEAARPLKQYSANYFGQFIEYAMNAKNKGELAPLASFFATQASVGGLKGVLFIAEATAIVTALNYLFDTEIPTPEQLMLKTGLHDALVFGGLSTVMGYDVSSSSQAPSLPSMFSFPALDFTKKMVVDAGTYLLKKAQGKDTDQDRLRAAIAVSPNMMHEFWKNVWTPEGQPTANPNDPQLRGNYRRSDSERDWAAILGSKPLNESKADMLIRNTKQELKRDYDRKMDALDAIADRIQNKQPVDSALMRDYIKQGGDPSNLGRSIANRIKERTLTGQERIQDVRSMTPAERHKIETLNEYLQKQSPEGPHSMNSEGNLIPVGGSKHANNNKYILGTYERYRDLDTSDTHRDRLNEEVPDEKKIRGSKYNPTKPFMDSDSSVESANTRPQTSRTVIMSPHQDGINAKLTPGYRGNVYNY